MEYRNNIIKENSLIDEYKENRDASGLMNLLLNGLNINIKSKAAYALGQIKAVEAVDVLISSIDIIQPEAVRLSAIRALGQIGDKRAVDSLLPALKDDSDAIRRNAAEAIEIINGTKAIPLSNETKQIEASNKKIAWVKIILGLISGTKSIVKYGSILIIMPLWDAFKKDVSNPQYGRSFDFEFIIKFIIAVCIAYFILGVIESVVEKYKKPNFPK